MRTVGIGANKKTSSLKEDDSKVKKENEALKKANDELTAKVAELEALKKAEQTEEAK